MVANGRGTAKSKQKQTHIEKTRDMYTRSLRPLPPASLLPPSSSLRVGYPCFLDKKLDPSFLDKKHMLRHTNWTKTCQHLKTHAHTSFLLFAPNRRICLAQPHQNNHTKAPAAVRARKSCAGTSASSGKTPRTKVTTAHGPN